MGCGVDNPTTVRQDSPKGFARGTPHKKALATMEDNTRASSSIGKAIWGMPCPLILSNKERKKANEKTAPKARRTLPYIEGM